MTRCELFCDELPMCLSASFSRLQPIRSVTVVRIVSVALMILAIAGTSIAADPSAEHNIAEHGKVTVVGRVSSLQASASFESKIWLRVAEHSPAALVNPWSTGDIDGDGYTDVLYTETTLDTVRLARSNGRDAFRGDGPQIQLPPQSLLIRVADVDGDGCDDLITWSTERHALTVGRSACDGSFTWNAPLTLPQFGVFGYFAMIDFSGSGRFTPLVRDIGGGPVYHLASWTTDALVSKPGLQPLFEATALHYGAPGDFDGDGKSDLAVPSSAQSRWVLTHEDGGASSFASFPVDLHVRYMNITDLNGDGRQDIVVHTGPVTGWWAAFSNGTAAIERPISPPLPDSVVASTVGTGDFNGDGLGDLAFFDFPHGELWIALTAEPPPIAGVRVTTVSGHTSAVTDSSGSFTLDLAQMEPVVVRGDAPGFRLLPEQRTVTGGRTRFLRFAAASTTYPRAIGGKAVTLGTDLPGPYICLGYEPTLDRSPVEDKEPPWHYDKWYAHYTSCPDGYALLNINDVLSSRSRRQGADYRGTCCRLPLPDILTARSMLADGACPEGMVATGANPSETSPDGRSRLRCTEVNGSRYILGPPRPGSYWGTALSMRGETGRIPKSNLPLAFRHGAGRLGFDKWDSHGCVGQPWGSLFTGGTGRHCMDHRFRELQYAGAPGDPPRGTPVQMFPPCIAIQNLYDPTSGCITTW